MRLRERDLATVAAAALAWNRARLARIAAAKRVVQWPHPDYHQKQIALATSRKAEAKALAALRKACAAVEPAPITIDADLLPVGVLEGLNDGL